VTYDEVLPHEAALAAVLDDGRPEAVAKQHARGKLTARERIDALVDPGSFREIGALTAGTGPDGKPVPADGAVCGTADIDSRPVVVVASDFTAAGGSSGAVGNEKIRRVCTIAATRGIPVVMLMDGGGHRIHEGLDAKEFAIGVDVQHLYTRLSGWVPLVAAILGPGYGAPTLTGSLCDYVVAVRGLATLGMAPPPLVKAATGEELDEAVSGPDAQAAFGNIDVAVDSEEEAFDAIRVYLDALPSNAEAPLPVRAPDPPAARAARALDAVVSADPRAAYDMYDVIAGIVDEDSEVDLHPAFAPNLVTVLARVEGQPIGIVANQPAVRAGMLDAAACAKASRLVSLCDAFGIPVLTLIDLPGLAVGLEAERAGLGRASARLSAAYGAATAPHLTIVARKGYGGGYVMMSGGRTFSPELVVAWPHAETAVMAAETAVELVFKRELEGCASDEERARRRREIAAGFDDRASALRGAEGFGYDAIIRPSETRAWLAELLPQLPRRRLMETLTPRRHGVEPL
jgi:propionyl-CoA carboxylase beta chain